MKICDELRHDHAEILELLGAVKKGRGFESSEWRDNLFAARKLFTAHLAKEDAELYPLVQQKNPDAAAKYHDEMNSISAKTIEFLDKYKESHSGPEFSKDYANLVNMLNKRIEAEEKILFPIIE